MINHDGDFLFIHLLGLDFCKDNDLEAGGAMLVFRNILREIIPTNFNLVVSTDHCEEEDIHILN
jgi:hypothetical protein